MKQLCNWFTNARKRLWQPLMLQKGENAQDYNFISRHGQGRCNMMPARLGVTAQKESHLDYPAIQRTSIPDMMRNHSNIVDNETFFQDGVSQSNSIMQNPRFTEMEAACALLTFTASF